MKKGIIISLLLGLISITSVQAEICKSDIGLTILKDPYNKKTFILEVAQNSPAQISNLPIGAEIIKIDDEKIKSFSGNEIIDRINGEKDTNLKLTVKVNGKKSDFNITRGTYFEPITEDNNFNLYWNQIMPSDIYLNPISEEIQHKLSIKYKNELNSKSEYWNMRKENFSNHYNSCMNLTEEEQNTCLLNLLNEAKLRTNKDVLIKNEENIIKKQEEENCIFHIKQFQLNNTFQNPLYR